MRHVEKDSKIQRGLEEMVVPHLEKQTKTTERESVAYKDEARSKRELGLGGSFHGRLTSLGEEKLVKELYRFHYSS